MKGDMLCLLSRRWTSSSLSAENRKKIYTLFPEAVRKLKFRGKFVAIDAKFAFHPMVIPMSVRAGPSTLKSGWPITYGAPPPRFLTPFWLFRAFALFGPSHFEVASRPVIPLSNYFETKNDKSGAINYDTRAKDTISFRAI